MVRPDPAFGPKAGPRAACGPRGTLCNRRTRRSGKGICARMLLEPAGRGDGTETATIDATHLRTHRSATSPGPKQGAWAAPSGDRKAA